MIHMPRCYWERKLINHYGKQYGDSLKTKNGRNMIAQVFTTLILYEYCVYIISILFSSPSSSSHSPHHSILINDLFFNYYYFVTLTH